MIDLDALSAALAAATPLPMNPELEGAISAALLLGTLTARRGFKIDPSDQDRLLLGQEINRLREQLHALPSLIAEIRRLRAAVLRLANAANDVGVRHFDSDCLPADVQEMQDATLAALSASQQEQAP